jgi:nucleoside-diphosphate-sugar epimerase
MKLFGFGLGYTATALATRLADRPDLVVAGTRRTVAATSRFATVAFRGDARTEAVVTHLADSSHVLVSIPPGDAGCPALHCFHGDLARLPKLRWVGYLSTIGVYGDAAGAWVDEATPVKPTSERAVRRAAAETSWLAFGQQTGVRVEVFRLPGIYGPGRSVLDALAAGTARRIIKPGQVFNRIHVADIAGALDAAMQRDTGFRIFNVTDDEPGPPEDVVAFGAALLGVPTPPDVAFADAHLSPMGASFYSEVKRVRNQRLKTALGFRLQYPTYRDGLRAIAASA